jgi:fructose-1,6-bisphosphatase/inositol monophosphatase family enzyme
VLAVIGNWSARVVRILAKPMTVFAGYQSGLQTISDVGIKAGDESLATIVDREIEKMVLGDLSRAIPNVPVFGEEGGRTRGGDQYYMYIDPVDGTREMTTETALSVIIVALMKGDVNTMSKADWLVGVVIAEPSTGRIWSAERGGGCSKWVACSNGEPQLLGPCHVWEGPISRQTSVFFDSSQGGINVRDPKHPYPLLTDSQNAHLYGLLNAETHVRVLGPNGQIEALVANGARGVAGSMSLHLGWPWDAAGALLVSEAGGAVLAYEVTDAGLTPVNPFQPNSYSFLVCANNAYNVGWLAQQLEETHNYHG